jgi:threonine dehydratase
MLFRLVRQILQATVYDVAIESPLEAAPRISQKLNNNIRLKREDLQPVFLSSCVVLITVSANFLKNS